MKKTTTLLIAALLLILNVAAAVSGLPANDRKVKGIVVDNAGEPLIGVSVTMEGEKGGTVTNIEGRFTIDVPDGVNALKFAYLGFVNETAPVKENAEMRIVMHEDLQQLEEVVVVGYGVQRKSHLTGGISKVNTEGIEDMSVTRLDQALIGKAAGLQILNVSEYVGDAPDIVIRGTASFSASSAPLVVVDGYPMPDGMDAVNPSDVESIEILKDAASGAIYGSQAANGVIMITTKSGSASKPTYSVRVKFGIKNNYKLHDIMTTEEYINQLMEDNRLLGKTLGSGDMVKYLLGQHNEINWQKMAFRTATYKNAEFSVSGGTKGVRYYISGAYTGDEGMMHKNYYDRFNVRARIDANLSKHVSVGVNLAPSYTRSETPGVRYDRFFRSPGWLPVVHDGFTSALTGVPVGEYARGEDFNNVTMTGISPETGLETTVTGTPWNQSNNSAYAALMEMSNPSEQYRMQVQGYIDINIIDGLKFRSSNSYNLNFNETNQHINEGARNPTDVSRGTWSYNKSMRWSSENTLSYSAEFKGMHTLDILAGASFYKTVTDKASILGFDFPGDDIFSLSAAGRIDQYDGTALRTGTWKSEDSMASFFGRVNYSLLDRYLFSATIRADGSSKFGDESRWGTFPSISAGWRLSEEPFIRDNVHWINQMKLRASYGITGTNAITNYANTDLLDAANYVLGPGNGSVAAGTANNSQTLGNSRLQWEQTAEFDLGLDLTVLNGRIGLTFDYYYATTKSLLYEKTINSVSGYTKAWTNEGRLRNRGYELELTTYNIKKRNFRWQTSLNFSRNENRLLDLGGPAEQITPGTRMSYIARVGDPLIQYYGYKTIGVWKSQEEIDANPHYKSDRPGGLRVLNTNGDEVINDDDRVPLGSPYPDFTWGMTNKFNFYGFDISFVIQGQVGGKVYNDDIRYTDLTQYIRTYIDGRWLSPEHPGNGKVPYYNYGIQHAITDYAIEDAGYVALRDVTLGYNLQKNALRKIRLSGFRIYLTGQNLLYFWDKDYRGINPEARTKGTTLTRNAAQSGVYPIIRTFSLGVNINF